MNDNIRINQSVHTMITIDVRVVCSSALLRLNWSDKYDLLLGGECSLWGGQGFEIWGFAIMSCCATIISLILNLFVSLSLCF